MALKTETRTIDGLEVSTTQFPALRGFRTMTRLAGILAPVLSNLEGVSLDSDISELGPALTQLFMRLADEDAEALASELLISTSVQLNGTLVELNDRDRINMAFDGSVFGLVKTLIFVIEVNYGDFFGSALAGSATEN
jgi:hypothetical protein